MNNLAFNETSCRGANGKNRKNSQLYQVWLRLKKSRTAMLGLVIITIFLLAALFADIIVPYENAIQSNKSIRLEEISADHWFGTDTMGRDVFARIIHGSRNSLKIGIIATAGALLVGGSIGAMAGYYGGKVDNLIMRLIDILSGIPPILLSLAIVAALGASLTNLIISLIVSNIPNFVRLVRASVLTVTADDFIEAAISYGSTDFHIILKHVIPNAMGPIIVQSSMTVSTMIIHSAGLGFLGMGVKPPAPEWGSMLSDAVEYMRSAPRLLYFPGISIVLSALSFNLLGDGLRDALDPRLKD